MARLELTLLNEKGEARVYRQDFVSGQRLLDFWELQIELEKNSRKHTIPQIIVKKAEYVASLFNHSDITAETIINGINSWELLDTLDNLISRAIGNDEEDSDPKTETTLLQQNPENVISLSSND